MKAVYWNTHEGGILIPVGIDAPSGDGRASMLRDYDSKIKGHDCLHMKVLTHVLTKPSMSDILDQTTNPYTGLPYYRLRANRRQYVYGFGSYVATSVTSKNVTYYGGPTGYGEIVVNSDFTTTTGCDILVLRENGVADVRDWTLREYKNGQTQLTENFITVRKPVYDFNPVEFVSGNAVAERLCYAYFTDLKENWLHYASQLTPLGVLANRVASNVDFNRTNTLALALDTVHLATDFKRLDKSGRILFESLKELVKQPSSKNLRSTLQSSSSVYLGLKYGYRLTYQDFKVASEAALGLKPAKARSAAQSPEEIAILSSVFSGYQALTFSYEFEGLNKIYKFLGERGLEIRATDLWDLVPYSFVVDWFLGIGDALECFDNTRRLAKMDLSDIWWTQKMTSNRIIKTDSYTASAELTFFRREGLQRLPALSPGSTVPSAQDHLVEGTALFIQRVT